MARERMVTRTVEQATVEMLTVKVSTQEVGTVTYAVSATIPKEKVTKYIQKTYDTDDLKNVSIKSYNVTEVLYGMTEQDFIAHATVLPPRQVNGD